MAPIALYFLQTLHPLFQHIHLPDPEFFPPLSQILRIGGNELNGLDGGHEDERNSNATN